MKAHTRHIAIATVVVLILLLIAAVAARAETMRLDVFLANGVLH